MCCQNILDSCDLCLTAAMLSDRNRFTCQIMTGENETRVRQLIARRIAHGVHACCICSWQSPICQSSCVVSVPPHEPYCVDIALLSFDCAIGVCWLAWPFHDSLRALHAAGSSPDACVASGLAVADHFAIIPVPSPGFLLFGPSSGSSDIASMPMCFAGGSSASLLLSQYLWRPPD